jgi:hypothetical protein
MRIYGDWKPINVMMVEKVRYAIGSLWRQSQIADESDEKNSYLNAGLDKAQNLNLVLGDNLSKGNKQTDE